MNCPLCDGNGWIYGQSLNQVTCPLCNGKCRIHDDPSRIEVCPSCRGLKTVTRAINRHMLIAECDVCSGWGKIAPLAPLAPPVDGPAVVYIEAGKPYTAHRRLETFFPSLIGEIRICDPYFGMNTLLRLELLEKCNLIKFLTQKPDAQMAPTALKLWQQEHNNTEFRRASGREIHDRYLLSDSELILLGHGLKDVGTKESFIIRLDQAVAADLMDTVRNEFDAKWKVATPITI